MLYLDNSATTQVLESVKTKMMDYLMIEYGNPSSKYYSLAENAAKAVEQAKENIANLLSVKQNEIIFTSGATESNNMIIKGVANYYAHKGKHVITSKAEHSSVLNVCEYLEEEGYEVSYLDVDQYGRISLEQLKQEIREDTILVSLIWGNNEVGSLNPIKEIADICMKNDVFFHTDATQVVGKIEVDLEDKPGISFLSFSAHKMHGPKGIGAVYIKSNKYNELIPLTPLIHGGGQESGLRGGTYPVHNIVGFGEAARVAKINLKENIKKLELLENQFIEIFQSKFNDKIKFNSDSEDKIPGIINIQFKGIYNQVLLKEISHVVAASSGSACSTTKPSHVLSAIGLTDQEIRESVRFSLSAYLEEEDLEILKQL